MSVLHYIKYVRINSSNGAEIECNCGWKLNRWGFNSSATKKIAEDLARAEWRNHYMDEVSDMPLEPPVEAPEPGWKQLASFSLGSNEYSLTGLLNMMKSIEQAKGIVFNVLDTKPQHRWLHKDAVWVLEERT